MSHPAKQTDQLVRIVRVNGATSKPKSPPDPDALENERAAESIRRAFERIKSRQEKTVKSKGKPAKKTPLNSNQKSSAKK